MVKPIALNGWLGRLVAVFGVWLCAVASSAIAENLPDYSQNTPARGTSYMLPYASGQDLKMLQKPVELACLDGAALEAAPTGFYFTAVFHNDYPLRPSGFGPSNATITGADRSATQSTYDGNGSVIRGASSYDFGLNELFVSAQLWVVVPTPGADQVERHFPVAPAFDVPILDISTGPGRFNALAAYRIDCNYTATMAADETPRAGAKLGRADFFPTLGIKARPDAVPEAIDRIDRAMMISFQRLATADPRPPLSQYFLRSGDLANQVISWPDFKDATASMEVLLRNYVERVSASEALFRPQFLPIDMEEIADVRFLGLPNDTDRLPLGDAPQTLAFTVILEGASVGAIAAAQQDYLLSSRAAGCENAVPSRESSSALIFETLCRDEPDMFELFRAEDPNAWLQLVPFVFESEDSIAVIQLDSVETELRIEHIGIDGAVREDPSVTRTVAELLGMTFPGMHCAASAVQPVTLDTLISGVLRVSDCVGPQTNLDISVPQELVMHYPDAIISACAPSVRFDLETGSANCTIVGELPTSLEIDLSPWLAPITLKVSQDASAARLDHSLLTESIVLSDAAVAAATDSAGAVAPVGWPVVKTAQFASAGVPCGSALDVSNARLSVASTGCEVVPSQVLFGIELTDLDADVPAAAFRRVTSEPIDLRPAEWSALGPLEFARPIDLDVLGSPGVAVKLGGPDSNTANVMPGWSMELYSDVACADSSAFVAPDGQAYDTQGTAFAPTWPTYAKVTWWQSSNSNFPRSDCTRVTLGDIQEDDTVKGTFDFIISALPSGRGVLVFAISQEVNAAGRRGAFLEALTDFGDRYREQAIDPTASVTELEIWDVTAQGRVQQKARASELAADNNGIARLFGEGLQRGGAPDVPDFRLIERNARLSDASAGAVLIFDGSSYSPEIESLFFRIASDRTATPVDRFWLFVVDGCDQWTNLADSRIRDNCTNMIDLSPSHLRAALGSVLSTFLLGEN